MADLSETIILCVDCIYKNKLVCPGAGAIKRTSTVCNAYVQGSTPGAPTWNDISGKPAFGTAATANIGTGTGNVAEGAHTHTGYVAANNAITPATNPKVSYDAKGLITSGAALGTGDIPDLSGTYATSGHTHAYSTITSPPTLGNSAAKDTGTTTGTVATGDHTHTGYVASNTPITGAEKCKITFDAKGLVTSGTTLGTGDIPDISSTYSVTGHNHTGVYAVSAAGVTNGDSHDHSGGDGAQLDHTGLSNIGTNTHAQIDTHIAIPNPGDISAYRRNGTTRPRWYTMPLSCTALSVSGALTAGRMYAIPFYCPKAATTDYLAVNCTTLVASGELRLGIYNDTNGEPGTLLIDAGIANTSATGVKTVACAQALTGGSLYWLAALSKSATHAFRAPALAGVLATLGADATLPTTHITHFYAAQAYGALPGTFPTVTQGTGIVFPLVYVRLSAGGK